MDALIRSPNLESVKRLIGFSFFLLLLMLIAQSLNRSIAQSLNRSIAQSLNRSIAQSLNLF
jgi:hypothetical protein